MGYHGPKGTTKLSWTQAGAASHHEADAHDSMERKRIVAPLLLADECVHRATDDMFKIREQRQAGALTHEQGVQRRGRWKHGAAGMLERYPG
jgi:hypothetical protein